MTTLGIIRERSRPLAQFRSSSDITITT